MQKSIDWYQQHLNLSGSSFSLIDHDEAMIAIVYEITRPLGQKLILKICVRPRDYFREAYFLNRLANIIPVPRVVALVNPDIGVDGALLMERLPGALLLPTDLTDSLAYDIGAVLARIHMNRTDGYGDPADPNSFSSDPSFHYTRKFEEGFSECTGYLPPALLEQCRRFYDDHVKLLSKVDGPCVVHRDFRPGNLIVSEGKLTGVIDWASGRSSFAEEDFCAMEHGEWGTRPSSRDPFLAGYASLRAIPDYGPILPLLRLNQALAIIGVTVKTGTWCSRHEALYTTNRRFLENLLKIRG